MPEDLARGVWRKSTLSHTNGCVEVEFSEVAVLDGGVWGTRIRVSVRDSKDPAGPVLVFTAHEWQAFSDGMQAGEFALPIEDPDREHAAKLARRLHL